MRLESALFIEQRAPLADLSLLEVQVRGKALAEPPAGRVEQEQVPRLAQEHLRARRRHLCKVVVAAAKRSRQFAGALMKSRLLEVFQPTR